MNADTSVLLLAEFSKQLAVQTGLYFPEERFQDLERGISSAAKQFGSADVESCLRQLLSKPLTQDQIKVLASYLTVGETYFFRDKQSFTFLETVVLPELIRNRQKSRRIRIWSAGCSSGEEPYSVAILLNRLIPQPEKWNISLLATDINPIMLARAEKGVYGEWAFRDVPESIRNSSFSPAGKNSWKINERAKHLVTFSYHNLVEDPFPSLVNETNAMDVILCRNVLLYFSPQNGWKIVSQLANTLTDGGWLIVSPVETPQVNDNQLKPVQINEQTFFRKEAGTLQPPVTEGLKLVSSTRVPPSNPVLLPSVVPSNISRTVSVSRKKQSVPSSPLRPRFSDPARLIEEGRFAEAAAILEKTLAENPVNNNIVLLVRAYANYGDLDRALAWCRRGIASDPLNPVLYYLLAIILEECGDVPAGLEALRKTLYLDPDFILAHIAFGTSAQRIGREKEATLHFTNARMLLERLQDDDPVPESEGITAGNLRKNLTNLGCAGS